MQPALSPLLTLAFMRLGHPLREAECLSAFVVISVILVLTLMGYRICDAGSDEPAIRIHRLTTIPGIHAGISGSIRYGNVSGGCPSERLFLFVHAAVKCQQ